MSDFFNNTTLGLMRTFADSMANVGSANLYRGGELLVVIGPEHAQDIANDGWTKQDIKYYLFEYARKPYSAARLGGMYSEQVRQELWPHWIDYTREDYRHAGEAYDVIFDAVHEATFATYEHLLKPGGRLLLLAAGLPGLLEAVRGGKRDGKRVFAGPAKETLEHLLFLSALAEAGAYRPVIDQVFPLDRIVDAHARVDTGRKRGSVVIAI
jgi:hypothetical protein